MSISLRCCGKDQKQGLRKCSLCGKNFTKFVVRIKDEVTGKWRSQTVTSFKLAKEIEGKFKTEKIEERLFDKKKKDSLSFEKYLCFAKLNKKSWKDDQLRWEKHVAHKNYQTKQGIWEILNEMQDAGYKPATVHHVLKLIKRVYNWHIQNELYFQDNPCNTIKLQKYDNRVNNILTKNELLKLIEFLHGWKNKRAALVVLFGIYTGRRKGEIVSLKWEQVNFEHSTITCLNTKNGTTQSFPINNNALTVLKEAYDLKISALVFPSSNGDYYYSGLNSAWNRLKNKINLNIRFHDIRCNYATILASSNKVDIYTLKKLLGHKDINLTMRYAHLMDDVVKNANNVIDDIF